MESTNHTKNCIKKFTTVLQDFIKDNDIYNFEKFIKILYIEYKSEVLNIFEELLQELIYHYYEKNIIFIKLIIDNISNKEFIDIIEKETSFIFNLFVEYHYDIEFQKYIIDKNVPEYLLFNSIINSIIYMGGEYLIENSFNNEINDIRNVLCSSKERLDEHIRVARDESNIIV